MSAETALALPPLAVSSEPVDDVPVRRLRLSGAGIVGLSLIAFWIAAAVAAPVLATHPPNQPDMMAMADPFPSRAHWLGTDILGRDIFSRILWGARTVLLISPAAVAGATLIGLTLGLFAGYRGGWIDTAISRVCDVVLSFPVIILYMIILTRFGASALNIVAVIAVTKAPIIFRLVRAATIELRGREYVAAALMRGENGPYIMFREILPNVRQTIAVDVCLRLGYTTIAIGVLGFLGIGLPPPNPDWGGMIRDGYGLMSVFPHMALFPAGAVSSLVIGFNLLAIGLKRNVVVG